MTQEEKAKAYDEAIERARIWKDRSGMPKDKQGILDDIFPELKESEDEKIRKGLINGFEFYSEQEYWGTEKYPLKITDILAWLEKQCKQKPVKEQIFQKWTDEEEFYIVALEGLVKDRWRKAEQENDDFNVKKMSDLSFFLKTLKKPEWSEKDIEMIDWLIRCCEKEHEELCNDKYGHQDIVSDLKRDCRKKWNWLESLKNKVVPQNTWKPSEEQMLEKNTTINVLGKGTINGKYLIELHEQLKKLREE